MLLIAPLLISQATSPAPGVAPPSVLQVPPANGDLESARTRPAAAASRPDARTWVLYAGGALADANNAFDAATKIAPEEPTGYFNLARALEARNEHSGPLVR